MTKPRVLVVDDEREIREAIRIYLRGEDIETIMATNGQEAVDLMKQQDIHLILMDVMMPGIDGIVATSLIREFSNVPIIMLTAKGETEDKVHGLEGGADDYIVKPFGVMELLSRVRAVLRRAKDEQPQDELAAGCLRMDVARHRVFADGRDVTLTHMEFELLRYLLINRGIALTRERLLDAVWGVDYPGDTRTVDVHMRTLRVKLGQASRYLQTVRGVGYRLEDVDAETNL